MPKSKKTKKEKTDAIKNRIQNGYSKDFGFLHIPKTGGTSLVSYGKKMVGMGYSFPVAFGHSWTVAQIHEYFPKIKLTFILRDPLERMISGFNSRLRQGRPSHNSLWTPAEAAVMAMLPSARHLLDAMLANDQFSISATSYAMRRVSHLRWNYRFYFEDPESVRKHTSTFRMIGRMEEFDTFVKHLSDIAGAPWETCRPLYEQMHAAAEKSSSVLGKYSDGDIAKLKNKLAKEYLIYDELCRLADEIPFSAIA